MPEVAQVGRGGAGTWTWGLPGSRALQGRVLLPPPGVPQSPCDVAPIWVQENFRASRPLGPFSQPASVNTERGKRHGCFPPSPITGVWSFLATQSTSFGVGLAVVCQDGVCPSPHCLLLFPPGFQSKGSSECSGVCAQGPGDMGFCFQ